VILETLQPPELQPVLKLEVEGEKQSEAATSPLNPGKPHHHPCIPVPSFAVSYLLPNDHTTTQFLLPGAQLESCAQKLCHSANCGHPQVDDIVVVINNGQIECFLLLLLLLLLPPLLNLKTLLCPMPGLNLQLFKKKAILGFLRAPS
jgi:hypothetical protein